MREFGFDRFAKSRALVELERAGLIRVQARCQAGRCWCRWPRNGPKGAKMPVGLSPDTRRKLAGVLGMLGKSCRRTRCRSSPVGGSHTRTSAPQAQWLRRYEESLRNLSSNYLDTHRRTVGIHPARCTARSDIHTSISGCATKISVKATDDELIVRRSGN